MRRTVFLTIGFICLVLGIIGMVAPILPGSVLLFVALLCFSKSSERVHSWLINNKWFGYYFQKLERGEGIPLSAKIVLTAYISGCIIFNLIFLATTLFLKIAAVFFGLAAIAFVLRVPTLKK